MPATTYGLSRLIVEDDPLVALMLEGYLEALDLQTVACVESVNRALDAIRDMSFDAAIVDVYLADGETSGPVAHALRAACLPFIVTTGSGAIDAAYEGAPMLAKPFRLVCLAAVLKQLEGPLLRIGQR